jgi:hypothetical protein
MVRKMVMSTKRRQRPGRCECPDSSSRWAITEGIERLKGGITGFKQDAHDFKETILPGEATKKYNTEGASFAAQHNVLQDTIKKDRFWIDDDKYVDVYLNDPASVMYATQTIKTYRQYGNTAPKTGSFGGLAMRPTPKSKHDEDVRKLKEEAEILQQKSAISTYKKKLAENRGGGGRSGGYAGVSRGGGTSRADVLGAPPMFGSVAKTGKNTNKVYNYDKVSKVAGTLISSSRVDGIDRVTPGDVGLVRHASLVPFAIRRF